MAKRYDDEIRVDVESSGGIPAAFRWRGRRYEVVDVIGRWRIEGRGWEDGGDREYWRGGGRRGGRGRPRVLAGGGSRRCRVGSVPLPPSRVLAPRAPLGLSRPTLRVLGRSL